MLAAAAAAAAGRGPRVVAARLDDDLGTIRVTLDQPLSAAPFDCAALVVDAARVLGAGAVCEWSGPAELAAHLGAGAAAAAAGAAVALRGGALLAAATGLPLAAARAGAIVAPPRRGRAPTPALAGPGEVAECDAVEIAVQGARAGYTYAWGCADDAALDAALRNRTARPEVVIGGAALVAGRAYTVTARACAPGGALCSDPAVHTIARRNAAAAPFVIVLAAPGPTVSRSRIPPLEALALPSTCSSAVGVRGAAAGGGGQQLTFQWTLRRTDGDGVGGAEPLGHTGPAFAMPSAGLAAGGTYAVSVAAVDDAGAVATAERRFAVAREPVVAVLDGGGRSAAAGSTVWLNASRSYSPDACPDLGAGGEPGAQQQPPPVGECDRAGLTFAWACAAPAAGAPCRLRDGSPLALPAAAAVGLDLARLALPDEGGDVWVTVTVAPPGSAASQTARIAVGPAGAPAPLEVRVAAVYTEADALAVRAEVEWGPAGEPQDAARAWRVIDAAAAAGAAPLAEASDAATADPAAFPAGARRRVFVVRLDSPWARAAVRSGGSYAAAVAVAGGGRTGAAWLDFARPVPPTGGSCSAAPAAPALLEPIVVQCGGWASPRPPLRYRFAAAPGLGRAAAEAAAAAEGRGVDLTWTPPAAEARFEVLLPPGPVALLAMVIGADGSAAVVVAAVLNVSGGGAGGTGIPLGALSTGLASMARGGRVGPLLLFADTAAAQLNGDTCPAGGGGGGDCGRRSGRRRLLGSSSGYRMAVRKLLLSALSGAPLLSATAATAPALLRSARRIATAPAELDAGATNAGAVLLATVSGAVGAGALRAGGGALEDAARLGRSALLAARRGMVSGDADRVYADIAAAFLDLLSRAAAGRLEGEAPPAAALPALALSAVPISAAAGGTATADADTLPTVDGAGSGTEVPTGLAVVRAGAGLIPAGGAEDGTLMADGLAVRLLYSGPAATTLRGKAAVCLATRPWCVQFVLPVGGGGGGGENKTAAAAAAVLDGVYEAECLWWDGARWDPSACAAPALLGVVAGRAAVSCACACDGVFRASVRRSPPPQLQPPAPEMAAVVVKKTALIDCVVAVAALSLTAVVCVAVLLVTVCWLITLQCPPPVDEGLRQRPVALKAELGWVVVAKGASGGAAGEPQLHVGATWRPVEPWRQGSLLDAAKEDYMLQGSDGMAAALAAGRECQWRGSGYASSFQTLLVPPPTLRCWPIPAALDGCCNPERAWAAAADALDPTPLPDWLTYTRLDNIWTEEQLSLAYNDQHGSYQNPPCIDPEHALSPMLLQLPTPFLGSPSNTSPGIMVVVGTPVLDLLASNAKLPLACSDPSAAALQLASVGLQPVDSQQGFRFLDALQEDLDSSCSSRGGEFDPAVGCIGSR